LPTGKVKWFNQDKGLGFITPDDGGTDIFLHITAAQRGGIDAVKEGMNIAFEVAQDRRTGRSSADNIRQL